jgi:hypothetical protein
LTLLVGGRELRELLVAVIRPTIAQLGLASVGEGDLDAAQLAVGVGMGALEADDVVARERTRCLRDAERRCVVERLAAGVMAIE